MMQHTISRLVHASTPADFLLKPEHVDLAKLMTRACDYYRPTAERSQVEINCRSVGTVPTAWADRVAVAVVADNLLSNAVKFSPEGSAVMVQIQPGPGGIVCSVRDQGPGLTPTELSRLFQRVVRSGPPSAGHQPRQGYGFAIAMELVDRMGGRMWYENGSGKGSVFFFSLPYAPVTTAET
jgi:signal transduction histidine kinase